MADVAHRTVNLGDTDLHVAEKGSGVPVIMCHGFPGLWYTWRHQFDAIAGAGWHAVAPDMLGYGRSGQPADPRACDSEHVTNDLVRLLDALGAERGVFVGHDFGARSVWDLALRAPDRVLAVINLSVPYTGRPLTRPSETFSAIAREHFLHMHYFQEPGQADRELDGNPKLFLQRVFWALSGQGNYVDVWQHPSQGNGYIDVLPQAPEPPWSWLETEDLDYYVSEFSRTGFTGGLSWYRAADYCWEQAALLNDDKVTVPTQFIAGGNDIVLRMSGEDPLEVMKQYVPGLRDTVVIPGAGHFVQMERPLEVNGAIVRFLNELGEG